MVRDAWALEEGVSCDAEPGLRGRSLGAQIAEPRKCRWQSRGGHATAEEETEGHWLYNSAAWGARMARRTSSLSAIPRPASPGSLTFLAASRHHTWASPALLPLRAFARARRKLKGSQSAGHHIPRSLSRGTSQASLPAPRLCHAPLAQPVPILPVTKPG